MTKEQFSEPAFPCKEIDYQESMNQNRTVYYNEHNGMSLRDYFAAKAMQGELAAQIENYFLSAENVSRRAYLIADEMIKQRSKNG